MKQDTIVYKGDLMKILVFFSAFLVTVGVFACSGHDHSHDHDHGHKHGHGHSHGSVQLCISYATKDIKVSSKRIGQCHIERFIKAGKIDSSWKDASYDKSVLKEFKGRKEWVVTFDNENGKRGKKLYIFLKESGALVAANFSGK